MVPTDDDARKHNQSLPGMGGVFNIVNFQLYHYAGNNPVKYIDPDGEKPRSKDVQRQIDALGTKPNTPITDTVILKFQQKAMEYVGNDVKAVDLENSELKKIAADDGTMVDSYITPIKSQRTSRLSKLFNSWQSKLLLQEILVYICQSSFVHQNLFYR